MIGDIKKRIEINLIGNRKNKIIILISIVNKIKGMQIIIDKMIIIIKKIIMINLKIKTDKIVQTGLVSTIKKIMIKKKRNKIIGIILKIKIMIKILLQI